MAFSVQEPKDMIGIVVVAMHGEIQARAARQKTCMGYIIMAVLACMALWVINPIMEVGNTVQPV